MDVLLHIGLSNAVTATLLAVLVACVVRIWRRPTVAHVLWLLVLLKLVTPPFVLVPLPWLSQPEPPIREFESNPQVAVLPASTQPPARGEELTRDEESTPDPIVIFPEAASREETVSPLLSSPAARSSAQTLAASALNSMVPTAERASASAADEFSWRRLVLGVWLGGSLLWFGLTVFRIHCFVRSIRHARPAGEGVQARARKLASQIGLQRCPQVVLLAAPISPLLWALGVRHRILLPAGLWSRLSDEQRDTLLLHELVHLHRRDHWVRRLELITLGLYWWHPVAWWARHEVQEAEERCCDDAVVHVLPEGAHAYAEALVATAAFLAGAALPLGASGIGHVKHLKRRVTMILGTSGGRPSRAMFWTLLASGALLLPWLPTLAQPPVREVAPLPVGDSRVRRLEVDKGPDLRENQPLPPVAARSGDDLIRPEGLGNRAEQVQAARDQVELLEAQLMIKKAQLKAAMTALSFSKDRMKLLSESSKAGVISSSELLKAQQEVNTGEAEIAVKQAELAEAEVRLKQASRRLDALSRAETRPLLPPVPRPALGSADIIEATVDLGRLRAGVDAHHAFQITNRENVPAHISDIKASGAWLKPTVDRRDLDPGQSTTLHVMIDASRVTGTKTGRIYVLFDKPSASQQIFQITAHGPENATPPPVVDIDRMRSLEQKLDALQKQIDALRSDLKKSPRGSGDKLSPPQDHTVINSRTFSVPVTISPLAREEVQELLLYVSQNEGKSYKRIASAKPGTKTFHVNVPEDGTYWFKVAYQDRQGVQHPEVMTAPAELKVRVETE